MMTMGKARRTAVDAEALAIALDLAAGGHVEDDPRVQVAARLRPVPLVRESARDRAKARMLRAFDANGSKATADAGSRDGDGAAVTEVHTAHLELPDGTRVVAADLEHIDPEKSARLAAAIEAARIGRRTGHQ